MRRVASRISSIADDAEDDVERLGRRRAAEQLVGVTRRVADRDERGDPEHPVERRSGSPPGARRGCGAGRRGRPGTSAAARPRGRSAGSCCADSGWKHPVDREQRQPARRGRDSTSPGSRAAAARALGLVLVEQLLLGVRLELAALERPPAGLRSEAATVRPVLGSVATSAPSTAIVRCAARRRAAQRRARAAGHERAPADRGGGQRQREARGPRRARSVHQPPRAACARPSIA